MPVREPLDRLPAPEVGRELLEMAVDELEELEELEELDELEAPEGAALGGNAAGFLLVMVYR